MQIEDAESIIIRWIRERLRSQYPDFGYDIFLPNVIRWHLQQSGVHPNEVKHPEIEALSPVFYCASWELCRRGIIRPGIRRMGLQATDSGSAGDGYSITPFGAQWAEESDHESFVLTEPQRFAQMLAPFRERFGPVFHERAQEAIRCYGAHNYLACCAMCGAAAESVLLAASIAKRGEEKTLKTYASAAGRSRVQKDLLAHVNKALQNEFSNLSLLLKYWRDEATHGKAAQISENEAYTSLALLLRLTLFGGLELVVTCQG